MSNTTRSEPSTARDAEAETAESDEDADAEALRAQVDFLRAENRRLRAEYARARRAGYRRTAAGLGVIGIVAVGAAALFPGLRQTLLVLGAIGLFGGVLTAYLTPERFVAAETGERVYAAQAETLGDLTGQLGLEETAVYVPVDGDPGARRFVPQHREYSVPDAEALASPLVIGESPDERGASFVPTGARLFEPFERTLSGSLGAGPVTVTEQVADALVEGFEVADQVDTSVDPEGGRATLEVRGAVYDDPDAPDNPLGSLAAVALARGCSTPVRLETTRGEDGLVLTCRWDADDVTTEADTLASSDTGPTDGDTGSADGEADATTAAENENGSTDT